MSHHNQGWLRREERRLASGASAEPAAATVPESQPVHHPPAPQPEQARPSMEQWPAMHPQEQPGQPEYSQYVQGSPQPSQQEPPQGHPVPGQQYPQYQPPQQQTHSDNPYAPPYRFEPGAAPREEGPQR